MKTTLINNYSPNVTGTQGIPNNVREFLLRSDRGETSLLLDALYFVGYRAENVFTVKDVMYRLRKWGIVVSSGLVRRALQDVLFECVGLKKPRGRGRPSKVYRLPAIIELVRKATYDKWFGVTDVLQACDLFGIKAYRTALHVLFLQRCPGKYSRHWLGARLGVSARTTASYEIGSTIQVIAQFMRKRLIGWMTAPAKALKGSMYFVEVVRDGLVRLMPYCQGVIQREIELGNTVYKVCRTANYYYSKG